jgi:hypothetical protein
MPHIGNRRRLRSQPLRTILIGAAPEFGEAGVLEYLGDSRRAQPPVLFLQGPADVVDRQILLAKLDEFLGRVAAFGRYLRTFEGRQEKLAMRVAAKAMAQHAKAARGIAKAPRNLGRAEPFDEVGTQRFVLAVGGVAWFEENAPEAR